MTAAVIALVVAVVALAGVVGYLAYRARRDVEKARKDVERIGDLRGNIADLRIEIADLERERDDAKLEAAERWRQYEQERATGEKRRQALREEIRGLEQDLASCSTPESVAARIERLLSKTSARTPTRDHRAPSSLLDRVATGALGAEAAGDAGGDPDAARPAGADDADR